MLFKLNAVTNEVVFTFLQTSQLISEEHKFIQDVCVIYL